MRQPTLRRVQTVDCTITAAPHRSSAMSSNQTTQSNAGTGITKDLGVTKAFLLSSEACRRHVKAAAVPIVFKSVLPSYGDGTFRVVNENFACRRGRNGLRVFVDDLNVASLIAASGGLNLRANLRPS